MAPHTLKHGEEPEHGGRLLERGFRVGAVAGVPAECGSAEARRFPGEDQEGELESVGEAHVLESGARHANPNIAAGAFAGLTDAGRAELGPQAR